MHDTTLSRRAMHWLSAFILLGACTMAWALPAPKDIEAAVNAGQYAKAETLLREVLQEKPGSARAHYELGQVLAHEAKYSEALAEVQRAKSIDSSLKFATSPERFQQTLDKIKAAADEATLPASTVTRPTAAPVAASTAPASQGLNLNYVLLGIGVLVVVAFLIRRINAQAARPAMPYPAPAPNAAGPVGFGAQYAPSGPGYAPGYGPAYGAPAPGGSGIGGAVLGGVAGLAAGYALTKAFEGDHHASNTPAASNPGTGNSGYVPFDAPVQPDLGSFDAGAGNGWDAEDAAGSEDNW